MYGGRVWREREQIQVSETKFFRINEDAILVESDDQCYRSGGQIVDINGHESILEEKKVGELAVLSHKTVLEIHVAEGGGRSCLNDGVELSMDWT